MNPLSFDIVQSALPKVGLVAIGREAVEAADIIALTARHALRHAAAGSDVPSVVADRPPPIRLPFEPRMAANSQSAGGAPMRTIL